MDSSETQCANSIQNANQCLDSVNRYSCCPTITTEIESCIGVSTASNNNHFWETITSQASSINCARESSSLTLQA
jgi:hypothetical protein